jgi:hypothetical protein
MNILGLHPDQYHDSWAKFNAYCEPLDLTPPDRAILWREWSSSDEWYEIPVPAAHFCSDPFYIGQGTRVRERVKQEMDKFWAIDSNKEVWVFIAGIGSGKSFTGSISVAYCLYLLSCLKRPAHFLSGFPGVSLSDDSEIVIMAASAAGAEQSSKIVYGDAFERITNSPYFKTYFPPKPNKISELVFPNRIRFSPGTSNWKSALGWNVFMFIVDEAAFGFETDRADYVAELFKALNQRRRSRFGALGAGLVLTSPGHDAAFVETLARQGEEWDHTLHVSRMTTWEAKDELTPGARVFMLDRSPDKMRVLDGEYIYVKPGYLRDARTNLIVRYKDGDHPEEEPAGDG